MSRNKQLLNQRKQCHESQPDDFLKIFSQSPVGTSTWNWILTSSRSGTNQIFLPLSTGKGLTTDYEPLFLLKVSPGKSWSLESSVKVTAKAGVFITKVGSVFVAPLYVLFRLSGNDYIYHIWINHYGGDILPSPLYKLQKMPYLTLLLIEDKPQPERAIKIENQINWSSLITKIESVSCWDRSVFEKFNSLVYSAQELWNRTTEEQVKKTTIAKLNDRFRNGDKSLGDYKMSRQVLALPRKKQKQLFKEIQDFSNFTSENDPKGEHNGGKVIMDDVEYVWKIDYLDTSMIMLSDAPEDINKTTRVLLVIRADEY
ncbi:MULTISPECIES: DUF3768 domain-containing protein [Okeania]|uniref:DUF3768 domain-containing protein n=1 Tax=Okeania hirsuta TaxID=1458930 RepID=A0A3N6NQD7_9CYAN|nr:MULTISPECIES: DUF3768 domain-containing protein [Okeania]NET17255.1 DUF3768 domain-containing protein [Okeania sp. SIO1H6]NES79621.1 DUF3768 domain-containing protein [Okeania sp. SIO1H4]NES89410.1 DUF3768 domain-containing protein [Okeania sp. SIO2B9]NET23282.1 DUF3768 domain-containing protein [Okeania sp. SIO1H5]NET96846.1 DUF3768 domain-containing protein [Okeania sp. SIO1H2]